jgi:hypothetical protein
LILNHRRKIPALSPAHHRTFNPTDRTLRQFAVIWVFFFGTIALLQELHRHHHVLAIVFAALAVTVGPLGLTRPRTIKLIFVGWMALVYPINWIISRFIMAVLFYGLFTPIALIFRLIGRDALALKSQPKVPTYWQPKGKPLDKSRYLRQF